MTTGTIPARAIRAAKGVGRLAAGLLLAAALLSLAAVGFGPLTGRHRLMTVLTGSMGPGMPAGSLAVLVPADPSAVEVGDVIAYQAPLPDRRIVTHRVVEVVEAGPHPVLRTKGDANPAPDPWAARLAGTPAWRRVAVIPHAGRVISFLRSGPVHHTTVHWIPAILLVAALVSIWSPGPARPSPKPSLYRRSSRRVRRRLVALAALVPLVAGMPAAATFTKTVDASNTIGSAADYRPPAVGATAVAKQTGYLAGAVKQGGSYYVYADVADSGNPPSGISSVTADVSAITSGQTSLALSAGSYSVEGVSYNYRSALQTAGNPLSGTKTYTITSTDNLGYSRVQPDAGGYSVAVDNTAPTATNISTGNAGGGTHGLAETGDTITFTFSERIDPQSILAGWTGASTSVTVEFTDGGCVLVLCSPDSFKIYNSGYTATLPFGTVDLASAKYYGCQVVGIICNKTAATFITSSMVQSANAITITLGTRDAGNGSFNTVSSNTTSTWDSVTTPYDAAGNPATGNDYTEADSDYEF